MKTHKVMDLLMDGNNYICIRDFTAKYNPFKLYKVWYEPGEYGMRKRKQKIAEYAEMDSILFHIMQMKFPKVSWDLTA